MAPAPAARKCVVWDLDDTLWHGVLLEGGGATLRDGAAEAVRALDHRGLLQSIASRSEAAPALERLRSFGLDEYFLFPQIHWGAKSESIQAIAEDLGIGVDAITLVDDQPFERDAVAAALPEVLCQDADDLVALLDHPSLTPSVVAVDGSTRRRLHRDESVRREAERSFVGSEESFIATLRMRLTIARAGESELLRAEELTARTHQLNTTGRSYSAADLAELRRSPRHELLLARLTDRYGDYGIVGLSLTERSESAADVWTLKLLLTSCRVVARGVGGLLLTHLLGRTARRDARLDAEFVANDRNRMTYVALRFAGFVDDGERNGDATLLRHDMVRLPSIPDHVTLIVEE